MKKDKERYLYALIICACVFISLGDLFLLAEEERKK